MFEMFYSFVNKNQDRVQGFTPYRTENLVIYGLV